MWDCSADWRNSHRLPLVRVIGYLPNSSLAMEARQDGFKISINRKN